MDAASIADVLGKARAGNGGWVALCPSHDDSTPSLSLTDADGKVLVHCHAGCPQEVVIERLKGMNLWATKPKPAKKEIIATYDYIEPETGEIKFQVVRYLPKDFRQRRPDGNGGWSWSVPASERILFNLPAVMQADPAKSIFIVEGEKDVAALAQIGCIATCNAGGAGKWDRRYSESLRHRNIIILPDNDEPGRQHAQIVASALHGIAKTIRIVELPGLAPKGDVSDWLAAGNGRDALAALCRGAPHFDPGDAHQTQPGTDVPATEDFEVPFRALGFNVGTYYYLSLETQQVIALTGPAHNKMNLFTIAPLQYWQREFPAKTGVDWDTAADTMMRLCARRGIFSPEILRGRGAWHDDGRTVLHCGDRLYVDSTPSSPVEIRSRFVYERALPLRSQIDNPLTAGEASQFLDLVTMLPWGTDMDALYLAGWCALAHIGGVLPWRPHLWVVGSKGSGKSHVMSQIIRPILGDNCLFVVSETTEAGVRQSLRHDALPVLFDEAEGEDQRSQDRLQRILTLVRQSSSETGGRIAKGTVSGTAQSFQIRSCFAFSSINASLVQQSDRSRVTVLELRQDRRVTPFETLLAAEARLLDERFIQRFYARSIRLASVIRSNSSTFARAVAAVMSEQRAGDQIGTLLAGAWSLRSDDLVTFEEASEWVAQHDWTDQKTEVASQSDERSLVDFLLQQIVKVQTVTGQRDRTIGELVDEVRHSEFDSEVATRTLGRLGIKVEGSGVLISNSADGIKRLLRSTPWAVNWSKILRRLPESRAAGVTYFGFSGSESRAVWVKI
jgi:putative DNA primase/helicase